MKTLIAAALTTLVVSTSVLPMAANAHDGDNNYSFSSEECSVDVNYGVAVEQDHIRFIDKDETVVQINNMDQLFIRGKQIDLDTRQQALLEEYAKGINEQVPATVNLALDAVEVAFTAVSHVMAGLSGEDKDSDENIDAIFDKIQDKLAKRFNRANGSYYLGEQSFDEIDQVIEEDLEEEIESIVSQSVGNFLINLGSALNDEEGDFDQRMEAFGERMENMGEEVELAVEGKAEKLEEQAIELCDNLKSLDQLEAELTTSITELADFDLIKIES